jgi:hypothetical protein
MDIKMAGINMDLAKSEHTMALMELILTYLYENDIDYYTGAEMLGLVAAGLAKLKQEEGACASEAK